MQDKIFQMLLEEDEITWQTIIYDLVKSEEMDPWDVDVSMLSQKYLETIKKLKEMDFRISGKIVLAASILLKIKSNKLVDEDILELERLISASETMEEGEFYEDFENNYAADFLKEAGGKPSLIPRTPQPRKRKVSIYDLVDALEAALEVKRRRVVGNVPEGVIRIPDKGFDISFVIRQVYSKIIDYFGTKKAEEKLTFSQLIPSGSREDKVFTFIPLLHLTNQRRVDIFQENHFGDIEIELLKSRKQIQKELGLSE